MFWTNLLKTSAQTAAAAAAGTAATASGVDSTWYADLRKPPLQPPPAVFPVVWTALYADLAVTSAAVLTELQRRTRPGRHGHRDRNGVIRRPRPGDTPSAAGRRRRGYRTALAVNLALNAGWSWVFFSRHDTATATVAAAALTASSADLARRAGQVRPLLGVALLPYAGWCGFATVLSGRIHRLNA
ncbi:tryptophan-rich sensory protein [Kocuria sediminis]|uniref:Tryptophan-rich sensory protein n=1 Tax=Kocuria sediminis TaxID=1038857 RepID=A0A6N8GQC4_9MICC|nr:TspO/MBR family protein [Kocuria sediminis]MUN64382.1 tryptophan-rich sensory protein [Kocuria sediminis]